MRQASLLILNTTATVGRVLLTVGLTLAVTRLLTRELGFLNFGVWTAVVAVGVLADMVGVALAGAGMRNMAFEVGRGDPERLGVVFNTCNAMCLAWGLVLLAAGAVLRPWVMEFLEVSPDRRGAAGWVYLAVLLQSVALVVAAPYGAALVAHQDLVISTGVTLLQSVAGFAAAAAIIFLPGDSLAVYAWLVLAVQVLVTITLAAACLSRYPQCRPRLRQASGAEARRIARYAGWHLVSQAAFQVRMHGTVLLLNSFFGAVVNAAYAIAIRTMGSQQSLAGAIQSATQPAMTSMEGRGDRERVRKLVVVGSKFLALASAFVMVPLLIETETILTLWLRSFPPYTITFVRLGSVAVMLVFLISGYGMAMEAVGDLATPTLLYALTQFAGMAAVVVGCAAFGWPPWSLPTASVAMLVVLALVYPTYLGRKIGLPAGTWVKAALLPCALVTLLSLTASLLTATALSPGPVRLVLVTLVNGLVCASSVWLFALPPSEKTHFVRVFRSAVGRAGLTRAGRTQ